MEFSKICEDCKKKRIYSNKYHLERAINSKLCQSCSMKRFNKQKVYKKGYVNPQWKSPNEIPYSWFSKYFERKSKKIRTGNITIEDVYDLWIKQDKKCALSGVKIGFNDDGEKHTCSIDRIDSNLEYVIENIQLVHKDVNMMKNKFDQKYFINICKLISENTNNEIK